MTNPAPFDPVVHRGANVLITDHLSVKPGENVLITTDTQSDPMVGPIIFNAAMQAGARPMLATINQLPLQGKLADPHLPDSLRAAMVSSDCWIDLTHPYIAGSQAQDDALKAGRTRCMVAGGMDCAALARLYGIVPLDALYELQREFDHLVAAIGRQDLPADRRPGHRRDVRARQGHRHQAAPCGEGGLRVFAAGICRDVSGLPSVRGRIVIVAAMHEWYGPLQRPLTLEVDGRIKRIVEDGPEAQVLDRALRRAGGGEYGHVIHFSYGLHPATRYRGTCFVEDIRTTGASAIGFGRPWWEPGGGENHPDGLVLRQNLWIDGVQILKTGVVIAPAAIAATQLRVGRAGGAVVMRVSFRRKPEPSDFSTKDTGSRLSPGRHRSVNLADVTINRDHRSHS
jgi:hypothetical protein